MHARKSQKSLIFAITLGSILEWYEIFLYIYWAPIIEKIFFDYAAATASLLSVVLVFGFGFLSRPLGGLLFGYIGDKWGRKTSFAFSIALISIPSIAIGFTPNFSTWENFAAIFLVVMRLLQGIPAGGELPGAMCYLEEMAPPKERKYIGSYAFVGAQIGGVVSMVTCLLFQLIFPEKFLVAWGWRISFFVGGLIGFLGFYLREKLAESPHFIHLKEKHRISRGLILESVKNYKWKMLIAFFVSMSEVMGFFVISVFPVIYFDKIFGTSIAINTLFSVIFLTLSAITIPLFGKLGDKYSYKPLFYFSFIGMLLVSLPFYFSVDGRNLVYTLICEIVFIFFLNFQLALLPSLLTDLFPTSIRYTSIGLTFNICDGLLGGIAPFLAIYIVEKTHNPASFVAIFMIATVISLISLSFVEEKEVLVDW